MLGILWKIVIEVDHLINYQMIHQRYNGILSSLLRHFKLLLRGFKVVNDSMPCMSVMKKDNRPLVNISSKLSHRKGREHEWFA